MELFLSMNKPERQIQIIRNTTGDRFTASVFDKLLSQGPEAVREALEPIARMARLATDFSAWMSTFLPCNSW